MSLIYTTLSHDSLPFVKRNINAVLRMFHDSESTGRHRFGGKKPFNGDKRRRCEEYGLKKSNYVRRKQEKVRYDTWRREEISDEIDEKLQNLHYANFLGDKYGDHGAPYNKSYVNIKFCDCMRDEDFEATSAKTASLSEEDEYYSILTTHSNKLETDSLDSDDLQEEEMNLTWLDTISKRIEAQYKAIQERELQVELLEYNEDDIDWTYAIDINDYYEDKCEDKCEAKYVTFDDEEWQLNTSYIEEMLNACMIHEEEKRNTKSKRVCGEPHELCPSWKRARCDDETFNV